jgi:hypothetical protein
MFDKYVKINEKKIVAGQTSSGVWYCKELVAETTTELKLLIGEVNNIMNKYNNEKKEKSFPQTPIKKEKKPMVKGLE